MSVITNQTNNFQNSENDIAQKFVNANIGQLNNTFTFSNEFIITFKYNSNFKEILNFNDVYLKVCEYIRIYKNDKKLNIKIENPKIEQDYIIEVKSKLKKIIEKLEENELKKGNLLNKFIDDMMTFEDIETEIANRTIKNQDQLISIFVKKSNEDKEIFELQDEYPDVEWICEDEMILDKMKFINFQIEKLKSLKSVVCVQNQITSWYKIQGIEDWAINFALQH